MLSSKRVALSSDLGSPVDELLHEQVVDAARMVLHLVCQRRHLLRPPPVHGRQVLLGVGVAVVLELKLGVRGDDRQLLQVLESQTNGGMSTAVAHMPAASRLTSFPARITDGPPFTIDRQPSTVNRRPFTIDR